MRLSSTRNHDNGKITFIGLYIEAINTCVYRPVGLFAVVKSAPHRISAAFRLWRTFQGNYASVNVIAGFCNKLLLVHVVCTHHALSLKVTCLRPITRSSATADGPRDAMCQSRSCQLLHNSVGTACTISPEQIEVMEWEGYGRPTYIKLVHSATTRSTVVGVIHKLTVESSLLITPIHRRLAVRNFKSPKCRNYSHDPDNAQLGDGQSAHG